MSDEHMDDLLREIGEDLNAVRPSPEFAAKVRQQVAAQPERRWFGIWQVATAVGVTACAIVAVVGYMAMNSEGPSPSPAPTIQATNVAPPAQTDLRVASAPVVRIEPRHAVATPRTPVVAARREPEVLVPSDQALAITRYLGRLKSGHAGHVPKGVDLIDETTGEVNVPKLIEIQPIVVDLLPGSADPRGGGRSH
jgi:hypothetical protein